MSQMRDKSLKSAKKWCYFGSYVKDGKRVWYKKRGFATKKDAIKAKAIFLREIENRKDDIRLEDLIERFERDSKKRVKESTIRKQHYVYNRLKREFPNAMLSDMTKEVLQDFIDRMDAQYKKKYVEKIYYCVHVLFNYAIELDYLEVNPMKKVKRDMRLNEFEEEMLFWEQEQFKVFIESVDDELDRLLFMTLYYMGTRIGEAMALQWNDVDFINGTITIKKTSGARDRWKNPPYTTPKTKNSYRTIKMPEVLYNEMNKMHTVHEGFTSYSKDRFVFGYERPAPTESVRRHFNEYIEKANEGKLERDKIPKIRLHDLRHSHASYLINNMTHGFTDFDIANRLGDTVATLHNTYAHWFRKKDQSIVDFMNKDCLI